MKFIPTEIAGAHLIRIEPHTDERGFFARTWCADIMREQGLGNVLAQSSIAFNKRRGTLRGLHWQAEPFAEKKIVRCTRGAVFDVIVDIRPKSPTYKRWFAANLSAENRDALYIPTGVAHGYQTLEDETELLYMMSVPYHPECAKGLRWNDPAFGIEWPAGERIISDRDAALPLLGG